MAELRYTGAGRSPLLPSMMSAPIDRDGLIGDLVHIEDNAHGANPYSAGSLLGKIVLVRRGKVTFDTKVRNVETAGGASALIVVDSGDGTSINVNIRNSAGGLHEPKLVLVGVERSAGEELIKLTRGGSVVRAAIHACSTPVGRAFQKVANSAPDSHGEGPPKVGLSADGKVSEVDVLGRSAAMIAAALGNEPLVAELLARLDDDGICCVDEDGDNALAHAARNGHLGTGRLLLQHKPSCSKRLRDSLNRAGFSPLSLAAEYGRLAFVQLLLECGADPNEQQQHSRCESAVSGDGCKPIHHAAHKGFHSIVRCLLRSGADATVRNAKGESAMDVATGLALDYLRDPMIDELARLTRADPTTLNVAELRPRVAEALRADLGDDVELVELTCEADPVLGEAFVAHARKLRHDLAPGAPACASASSPSDYCLNMRLLWHGCGPSVLPLLLRQGFKASFSSLAFNVYGAGTYFATDARLSTFFLTTRPATKERIPPDGDGCYTLVLAAVLLGRCGMREPLLAGSERERVSMESALRHPANRNPPVGCHSASGLHLKEVVIYNDAAAFPAFCVRFRLGAGVLPLPNPYDEDLRLNYSYLRALPDSLSNLLHWHALNGVRTPLDTRELLVDRSAPLVGGWTLKEHMADRAEVVLLQEKLAALAAELETAKKQMSEIITGFSKKAGLTPSMSHAMAFSVLDKDGSGSISVSELKAALVKEGSAEASEAGIQSLIDHVDGNGDGELQLDEFETFWKLFQANCETVTAELPETAEMMEIRAQRELEEAKGAYEKLMQAAAAKRTEEEAQRQEQIRVGDAQYAQGAKRKHTERNELGDEVTKRSRKERNQLGAKTAFVAPAEADCSASKAGKYTLSDAAAKGKWQYYVDDGVDGKADGWYDYFESAVDIVEGAYSEWKRNPMLHMCCVQSGAFSYMVDFDRMTQTNVSYPSRKMRQIRRD
jgi:hypothetical protein